MFSEHEPEWKLAYRILLEVDLRCSANSPLWKREQALHIELKDLVDKTEEMDNPFLRIGCRSDMDFFSKSGFDQVRLMLSFLMKINAFKISNDLSKREKFIQQMTDEFEKFIRTQMPSKRGRRKLENQSLEEQHQSQLKLVQSLVDAIDRREKQGLKPNKTAVAAIVFPVHHKNETVRELERQLRRTGFDYLVRPWRPELIRAALAGLRELEEKFGLGS